MLNKRWLAGAILGAFLTVTAGAFAPQATEASALTPNAIQTVSSETTELARHHGPDKHDRFDKHDKKKHDKHNKYDKKKHNKHKKYDKKHDKKHDKHKKYDRHDRDRYDRHHHGKPMPPRR